MCKKSSTFAAEMEERRSCMDQKDNIFVQFSTEEERKAALRKMVGMRQEWETRVREIMAKRNNMPVVQ